VEELLRRARAGEKDALEELFERCRMTLGAWASRVDERALPGGIRASDISQETALRAFGRFSSFKGTTEAEWFAWLQSIFHNRNVELVRAVRRKKRGEPNLLPLDSEALATPTSERSPSQASSFREEWRLLLTHLYQLPDDQQEAISLCHLKELPVAEVARHMGKTEAAVAGLLQRGLRTLRIRMTEGVDTKAGESASETVVLSDSAVALLAYLRRRDAGEKVDTAAFLAEHASCADELRAMLHWVDRLQALRPVSSTS
jgi:RNA polymerase sigma-70 factor (ECF subfamily)